MWIGKYSAPAMGSRIILVMIAGWLSACSSIGGKPQSAPIESREPTAQNERMSTDPTLIRAIPEIPQSEATAKVTPLEGPDFSKIETLDDPEDEETASRKRRESDTDPATLGLMADATAALNQNDISGAESITNRAIRISPREPKLWLLLAEVRIRQHQYSDAIALAERAIDLGNGDAVIETAGLKIIAKARRALGDTAAARVSLRRARALEAG